MTACTSSRTKALQKFFYRIGRVLPRRIDEATLGLANQLLTQRAQRRVVRSLSTSASVVHQPIPVSPRFPSILSGQGSPLIVGPLNGGMDYPPAFRHAESVLSRVAIALGRTFSNLVNAMLPGKLRAAVVLVANTRTREALPAGIQGRVVELPENAVDLTQWSSAAPSDGPAPNFLFIGRLVDWKALDLVLEALVRVPGASLEVVGDGPMMQPWRKLAGDLGLEERVHFHGWLSQPECAERLARRSCALVLPSLYECGGAVVLEAMASSRPVIATAWGGPADYLDATCGILIPPTGRGPLVAGFAQAMSTLLASPETCTRLGVNGRIRLLATLRLGEKGRPLPRDLSLYLGLNT